MLLLTLGVILIGSGALLWVHYLDTLPKVPVPSKGHAYPIEQRGTVVFSNLGETVLAHGLLISGFAVGAIGVG